MAWLDKIHHPERYIKTFFKWVFLGILMGALGGLLGAGFHHALHFVTHLRSANPWLIWLLPVGGLLGLDPGLAAALGLVGLFCCATNSPLASIVLIIEMFSGANIHLFALVCVICFVLSGNSGLYASQIIQFSKSSTVQSAREPQSTDSQGNKS